MILLKNGMVHPGNLAQAQVGSVLLEGDQIEAVIPGFWEAGEVEDVIDCEGLEICPGFIDAHSHNDFFAFKEDAAFYFEPFVKQGITTFVTGNCGFGAAGYLRTPEFNHLIGGGLFSLDGRDFSDLETYISTVDGKLPLNIMQLVGHGSLRISVNGYEPTVLSEEDLKRVERKLEDLLEGGLGGLSLGLMYKPGQFAPYEELLRLARLVHKHDKILTVHGRAYSKVSTSYSPPVGGKPHNLRALEEMLQLAKESGARLEYSHLIFVGEKSFGTVETALNMIDEANRSGLEVGFDLYSMDFGASVITVVLPPWYLALSAEKRRSGAVKARLLLEVTIARKSLGFGFEDILISNTEGMAAELEGKTIPELAGLWQISGFDAYLRAVEMTEGKAHVLMSRYQNDEILDVLRKHPRSLYMTDAWMERDCGVQNGATTSSFLKFLKLAVDQKDDFEACLHKMSSGVAERFGLQERGRLEKGFKADVTVLDLDELAYDTRVPEGNRGVVHVFRNGKQILKTGEICPSFGYGGEFVRVN